ncbi:MAG: hypothetical protein AAF710_05915 [Planctomycetota bacterium]
MAPPDPNLILDYVEQQLGRADTARFEAMLDGDPKLAALVSDLKRQRLTLRDAEPVLPPPGLADAAVEAVERRLLLDGGGEAALPPAIDEPTPTRFRLVSWLSYGAIAAVLALVGAVVFQSLQNGTPETPSYALEDRGEATPLADAPLVAQRAARGPEDGNALADAAEPEPTEPTADFGTPASSAVALAERPAAVERRALQLGRREASARDAAPTPAVEAAAATQEGLLAAFDMPVPAAAAAPTGASAEAVRTGPDSASPALFTLKVATEQPEAARTQLARWAVANSIDVRPAAANQAKTEGVDRQVLLLDEPPQVASLLDNLRQAPLAVRQNAVLSQNVYLGAAVGADAWGDAEEVGEAEPEASFDRPWLAWQSPAVPLTVEVVIEPLTPGTAPGTTPASRPAPPADAPASPVPAEPSSPPDAE